MIQKHAIPILEFDDNPQAVIMPDHEGLDLHLPKKCVYAFWVRRLTAMRGK